MTEETKMEEMEKYANTKNMVEECHTEKKKKRGSCGIIFLIAFVCFIVFLVIHCVTSYGVRTEFDSIKDFDKYGGVILVDIPEGAENIKYYCNKIFIFGLESAYSFVLNDEEEYEAFMEANGYKINSEDTVGEYMVNPPKYNDAFEVRDWHINIAGEDIKNYNVLYYDSFDASYSAIITDVESNKIIVIKYATL